MSNNPKVKTIADFTEKDRIAVPAVGVSVQSRFLQYAAARQWGDKEFDRLDKYTIANVPAPPTPRRRWIAGGTELSGTSPTRHSRIRRWPTPTSMWC